MAVRRVGPLPPCGFMVQSTAGGQLPLSVEKRAKGKKVTVIGGVQGNARSLCTTLTTLLGVGGTTQPRGPQLADVEVQGEQVPRVERVLTQLGCIRGPGGRPPPVVAERACGYDDFLRREAGGGRAANGLTLRPAAPAAPAAQVPEPPEDAPCRAWHGRWPYCVGSCQRPAALADVWDDVVEVAGEATPSSSSQPPRTGRWANPGARIDAGVLHAALQRLGMVAEVGESIRKWLEQRAAESARRTAGAAEAPRCAPRPSAAMAADASFTCAECGAAFAMKRTLRMHRLQHQHQGVHAVPSVPQGGPPISAVAWPSEAEAAAAAEDDLGGRRHAWAADWDEEADSEAASDYEAPAEAASLASWIDAALSKPGRRGQPRRGRGPGAASASASVPCPVCGELFAPGEIELHADACLEAAAAGAEPSASSSGLPLQAEQEEEAGCLPQELLESLLDLELSPEASGRFWAGFERRAAAGSLSAREAFLLALEECLAGDSGMGAGEDEAIPPPADPEARPQCPVCDAALLPGRAAEAHVERCLAQRESSERCLAEAAVEEEAPPAAAAAAAREGERRRRAEAKGRAKALAEAEDAAEGRGEETALERLARIKAEAQQRRQAAKEKRAVA